jgi:hypothetical protein
VLAAPPSLPRGHPSLYPMWRCGSPRSGARQASR